MREDNEDSFGYDIAKGVFVVCDGMGGQAAGEVASNIAVKALLEGPRGLSHKGYEFPPRTTSPTISERAAELAELIRLANGAIREAVCRDQTLAGMGSTIACVLVDGDFFSVGNVGDSRVYLIQKGTIQQLTQDHSLVMEQVRLGFVDPEQARKSGLRNVILRALGTENTVEPDLNDMIAASDDILLLTSDGLTNVISDQEILDVVAAATDLESACENLVCGAKKARCDDNVTCLLIRFVEERWYQTWLRRLKQWGGNGSVKVVSQV